VCIDDVPRNVRLVAGITATVRISSPSKSAGYEHVAAAAAQP
jgi:hypothetical protein